MKISTRHLTHGLLATAVLVLTACGGGGGSGTDGSSGSIVQGVAATGRAISNGVVTLQCVLGSTNGVNTQADGSFSIDIGNVTLPCVARVDYQDDSGKSQTLHSLVRAAGTVNITPVTDMVVANLSSSGVAADVKAEEVKSLSDERLRTATSTVKTRLKALGVDTTDLPDDVIGSKLVATNSERKGDRHDSALDDIKDKLREHDKDLEDVEHDMHDGDENGKLSTSTGLPGDAAAGKVGYEAKCESCHGPRVSDAVNSAKIRKAINENEGGMGRLSSSVTIAMADDIATYMANGVGADPGPVMTAQTISFASIGNQTMGTATPALVATASSGLPVTIASTTGAVCTVADTMLTLVAPGNCSLSASQGGSATYSAAAPVVSSFTVAAPGGVVLTGQTITFASPGAQVVGTPGTLSASADSGLSVSLASTTASVCSVSGSTLTPLAAGNCSVTANQAGNSVYAAAVTKSQTVAVTAAGPVVSAVNGKALYTLRCDGCHGPAVDNIDRVLSAANNYSLIKQAIANDVGRMGTRLAGVLSDAELADIAAFLATPNI